MQLSAPDKLIARIAADDLLSIVYQPIILARDSEITSYEALARPRFDCLPAPFRDMNVGEFFAATESRGLGPQLDLLVIDQVLRDQQGLRGGGRGRAPFPVSINLCPSTLDSPQFVDALAGRFRDSGVCPGLVTFELTERTLLSDFARESALPRLHDLGFRFAIDDFIRGYSNFGILLNPLIETVKVDQSITRELGCSDLARRFMRSLVMLLESIEKRTVVEGVETIHQFMFLEAVGCNLFQGFHFSHPLEPAALPGFEKRFGRIRSVFDFLAQSDRGRAPLPTQGQALHMGES